MIHFDLFPDVECNIDRYAADEAQKLCPLACVLKSHNYTGKYLFLAPASHGKTTSEEATKIHFIKEHKTFLYIDLFKATNGALFEISKDVPQGSIALIDSLDEVYTEHRKRAEAIINAVERDRRFDCIVVSSRFKPEQKTANFSPNFLQDFKTISILDFEPDKIKKLAQHCKIKESSFVYRLLAVPMYSSMAITISKQTNAEALFDAVQDEASFIELFFKTLLTKKEKEKNIFSDIEYDDWSLFERAYKTVKKLKSEKPTKIPIAFNTIFSQDVDEDGAYYIRSSSIRFLNFAAAKWIVQCLSKLTEDDDVDEKHIKDLLDFLLEADNLEMLKFAGELLRHHPNKENIIKALDAEALKQDTDWYFNLCLIMLGHVSGIDDEIFALGNNFAVTYYKRIHKYWNVDNDHANDLHFDSIENAKSRYALKTEENGIVYFGSEYNPYACAIGSKKDIVSAHISERTSVISYEAFQYCENLTSLIIPASVTFIGWGAFLNCDRLANISVAEDNICYKSIDGNLYSKNGKKFIQYARGKANTTFAIPNGVKAIGDVAFRGCSSLESVTIPNSVIAIGGWAFFDCDNLASLKIGDNVATIGECSFSDCVKLISVEIPNSVTTIGDMAFDGCSSLISVKIGDNVTTIGWSAFSGCSNLISVEIPNSVTSVGGMAFDGCSSLISVKIGDSVTTIGDWTFEDCSSLVSVEIPNSVTSVGFGAFDGCSSLASVKLSDSIETIDRLTFLDCHKLASVTIPNSVTSVGDMAFDGCSSLVSAKIGDSVTSIGTCAFAYCSNLLSITISDSVTTIGRSAFKGCSSLVSVEIPNSVTSIGERAFGKCSSLTSLAIPDSVETIGGLAFYHCSSLASVVISDGTSIDSSAFSGCDNLKAIFYRGEKLINEIFDDIGSAIVYYYSEAQPQIAGDFWHYVNGVPTIWN